MSKHTPGPWEYVGGDNASVEINIGETTANVSRQDKNTGIYVISREEMEANGKLAAAAPEMIDALTSLVGLEAWIGDPEMKRLFQRKVYLAIEKAIGDNA